MNVVDVYTIEALIKNPQTVNEQLLVDYISHAQNEHNNEIKYLNMSCDAEFNEIEQLNDKLMYENENLADDIVSLSNRVDELETTIDITVDK